MTEPDDAKYALGAIYANEWSDEVRDVLFTPAPVNGEFDLAQGFDLLDSGTDPAPENLIPLCAIDEASIAVVVSEGPESGVVRRWFLDPVAPAHQATLLDLHPLLYMSGLDGELKARKPGLDRILDEIGPAYQEAYLEQEKRPRDFIVRPVRIACQNVVVGLAAFAQDSSFDGLGVIAWQTCEVPHVVTHEGNRALAALTLCAAFKNGGTMEIRFDRPARISVGSETFSYKGHPEGRVPASLRRYGRTVGVALGEEDPGAITPTEARELFLAVTPMGSGLWGRFEVAIDRRGITPERLCFTLLSAVWTEVELDFILGCSPRASSILEGGADWRARSARQAEMDACRAARMVGMLQRRMNGEDAAGVEEGVRVVEDRSVGIESRVLEEVGAVEFTRLEPGRQIPWAREVASGDAITVFPRTFIAEETIRELNQMQAEGKPVAVAVPRDARLPENEVKAPVLRCPDRIADLDKQVEERLLTSRISRS
jgi:hypothetical protein